MFATGFCDAFARLAASLSCRTSRAESVSAFCAYDTLAAPALSTQPTAATISTRRSCFMVHLIPDLALVVCCTSRSLTRARERRTVRGALHVAAWTKALHPPPPSPEPLG